MSTPRSVNHFYWLDLVRFLAAFWVVVVHARDFGFVEFGALPEGQRTAVVAAFYALTRVGNEAVIVFFVLSGFLVGGRAIERIAAGTFRPLDYSIDRFARIMLPLVPSLVLSALVGWIVGQNVSAWHFLGNLLSLQGIFVPSYAGNSPLWSLSYEVWFYVLALAIGVGASKKWFHLPSVLAVFLIACIFTCLSATYLFCWLIGAYAYVRCPGKITWGYVAAGIGLVVAGIAGIQLGRGSISVSAVSFQHLLPSKDVCVLLLAGGTALLIQQMILKAPKKALWVKLDDLGTPLAAFSYTLYLTHYPIIRAMRHFFVPRSQEINAVSAANCLLMIVVSLAMAWGLYWLFESRTPEVRAWVRRRLKGKQAAA